MDLAAQLSQEFTQTFSALPHDLEIAIIAAPSQLPMGAFAVSSYSWSLGLTFHGEVFLAKSELQFGAAKTQSLAKSETMYRFN